MLTVSVLNDPEKDRMKSQLESTGKLTPEQFKYLQQTQGDDISKWKL
jgi:Spy/CpxP family protein refolding chaperone